MEKLKAIFASIGSHPLSKKFMRGCRYVARQFEGPHYHRFEVIFFRVLFAVVVYQSMPLGKPFSNATQRLIPSLEPIMADPDRDNMLRPPLLKISKMVPNANAEIIYDEQPRPNGLTNFVDLTWVSSDGFRAALPWLVFPALALYISGFGLPIALPILAFISLCSRTLYNSQGYIDHMYQMITLVLLAQTVIVFWWLFRNPREAMGFRKARTGGDGHSYWDRFVRYTQWMIVLVYVMAGIIKPIKSDGEWFVNSHYIGIQTVKTHRQNFYSDLQEGDQSTRGDVPLAKMMMQDHPNLIRVFLGAGVMLEIFAFIALWSRFFGLLYGLALIGFHYFNDILMGLYFFNFEKMVWIFLINLPFWIWWLFFRRRQKQEQEIGEIEPEPAAA